MAVVNLTRHLGGATDGTAKAQIFADDSGKEYYVKYKENDQLLRILTNEYISGRIAHKLGLPCPDIYIVEIDKDILPNLPAVNLYGHKISDKYHFATAKLENVHNLPPLKTFLGNCKNTEEYPGIILFDALVWNVDRRNVGNYIITRERGGFKFNIIDHGHCFKCNWTEESLPEYVGHWSDAYLPEMYDLITSKLNCFTTGAIENIKQLEDGFFRELVDEIPADWLISDVEKEALVAYLIDQRNIMQTLVNTNKSRLFTNWN